MSDATMRDLRREHGVQSGTLSDLISRIATSRAQEREELLQKAAGVQRSITGIIRKAELEMRSGDSEFQTKYRNEVDRMKSDLEIQQRDLESAKLPRSEQPAAGGARNKLLEANAIHNEIEDTTRNIQVTIEEAENTGNAANRQLVIQREQLQGVQNNLDETEDSLARSKKILSRMARRVITDKITQGAIIVVELGIVALIVWLKWFKNRH
eukprot:TRINITY_DN6388_c0_g1_i2.p1 TRINITY_DN6388_c0_g1~~TRINITY_DN6388_c0_g1_i2.p1  ORF type:complete len:211 (-),score=63.14 TRINITY_DN6388_c0_g1_i2:75-707(-)